MQLAFSFKDDWTNALFVPVQACSYSSSSEPDLKETFKKVLPAKRELLKKVKAQSDKKLGDVKVENALGGMRYVCIIAN
jgi:citrate synthase